MISSIQLAIGLSRIHTLGPNKQNTCFTLYQITIDNQCVYLFQAEGQIIELLKPKLATQKQAQFR